MLRPQRTEASGAGSSRSTKKIRTTKTAMVLNWRLRYAAAPSWTAVAISCIFAVPWLAASTVRTSRKATTRAAAATTATMITQVRLVPVTVGPPPARARLSLDICPP